MSKINYKYQAYYCEENIWQLAKQRDESDGEVWFIINPNKSVATAMQQAATDQAFVVWDYHVIYYSPTEGIFDLDTLCDFPCEPQQYLQASFLDFLPYLDEEYAPYFRVVSAQDYLNNFSSDRTHMLDESGEYSATPPPWNLIGKEHNLAAYSDFYDKEFGNILSLNQLIKRL
ncbi:MAG TPA: hypothetical protein EYG68_01530 [Leucothrix mucor]|nr:hypothetical protein [Leucothrix mucor]